MRRLARLCPHDSMISHWLVVEDRAMNRETDWCPGGEFLAEDALVIENTQQLIDELVQRAELATSSEGNYTVHWHFDIAKEELV